MERTGKALLHAKGCLSARDDKDLFMWIVGAFGARIRDLDLRVQDPKYNRISWDFLQNPTLSLESFRLHFNGLPPDAISDPSFSLFANNAPCLHSFFHVGIPFTIEAPWLSHLCRLYIVSDIDICQLLEILSRTPLLELLQVEPYNLEGTLPEGPTRRVNLIHLKDISISGRLSASVFLLDSIIPAQGCRLCLRTDTRNPIEESIWETSEGVFARYCQYYFDSNSPRHLSLELHGTTLLLNACLQPTQKASFPDFVLSIRGQGKDFIPIFLSSVSSCDLESVTHLDLLVNTDVSDENLEFLLLSLTSVHTLSTTPNALRVLNDCEEFSELFPLLHTLAFQFYLHSGVGDVEEFLSLRQELGPSKIKTLDFRRCKGLSSLHAYEDVQVLWKPRDVIKEHDSNVHT
jgi:hypothetical protein